MILHLLRMRRNVNRNVFNDRKNVSATMPLSGGRGLFLANDCVTPLTDLDIGKGVTLFLLKILLKVEERVEEVRGEFTHLKVTQGHTPWHCRPHHVQHLGQRSGANKQRAKRCLAITRTFT